MLTGFTSEQWKSLISDFGNTTTSSRLHGEHSLSWIIDSGCSNHVLKILKHVRDIDSFPVGLPDGESVLATKSGTVYLTTTIVLQNVYYVPKLDCNLISVSQLNDDFKCFVQFSHNICAIQDLHSRKLIGTGERRDGLYYLQQMSIVQATLVGTSPTSSLVLWHNRLGHPSEKVVKLLPFLCNSRDNLNKDCETCFRSKQHWDSFLVS